MNLSLQATPDEVSIEHVSVLQERLAEILDAAYPGDGVSDIVMNHFNPVRVREEMLTLFSPVAFFNLFKTELGKGVIMGAFINKFVMAEDEE